MENKTLCFLFLSIHVLSLVSATSRPLLHLSSGHQSLQSLTSPTTDPKGFKMVNGEENLNGKIGSSPPSCEHKCFGCTPCEAIQVPTIANAKRHAHFGVDYTNYEPEGWKCKCGPSFYSP